MRKYRIDWIRFDKRNIRSFEVYAFVTFTLQILIVSKKTIVMLYLGFNASYLYNFFQIYKREEFLLLAENNNLIEMSAMPDIPSGNQMNLY